MKWFRGAIALVLVSIAGASSLAWADHWHHGRARIGIGVMIGPGWGYPYHGPAYYPRYYYPPYVYPPYAPPVIVQSPPVYVEQNPAPATASNYWYYCDNPQGYYPYIKECPAGWRAVTPHAPAP